ncbi:mechanosensitive ion channel family protein [bacterium]|nr:mechanosensitive ion channel family protein [bacterium]
MLLLLQQSTDNAQADSQEGQAQIPLLVPDSDSARQETRQKTNELIERVLGANVTSTYRQLNNTTVFGLNAFGLLAAAFFLLLALFISQIAKKVMDRYLKPIVERTETKYDDRVLAALRKQIGTFVMIWGLFLAFAFIDLPGRANAIVWSLLTTWLIVNVGMILFRVVEVALSWLSQKERPDSTSVLDGQFIPMIRDTAKVLIILLVILTCVQSWGGDITAVLAGVGIGGLALAFAAQDTVANIFGSFMIFMDRPFKRGDWIKMAGVEGDVEEIGIRSTRIRCFDKTVVSVPNKIVTNENIQNFSVRDMRRINLTIGITYDADATRLRKAVDGIRDIIEKHSGIDQRFHLVHFTDFGASSLDILVYCFANTAVWADYLIIREDLMLRIMDLFAEIGVDFAFPSQSLYLHKMDGPSDIPQELRRGGSSDLPQPLRRPSAPEQASRGENEAGMDSGDG